MIPPSTTAAPRVPRATAIGVMAAAVTALGAPIGVLWARFAPPIHGVVALTRGGDRLQAYLGNESEHFFVAPFLMLGLLVVLAVVAAALAWQWQAHRGPGMVAGLSAGLVAAAGLATLIGALLVHRRYGVIDVDTAPVTPDHRFHYFTEGPPVFFGHTPFQIAATLLVPTAAAALGYALCAAWTVRDDLGGYPVVDPVSAHATAAANGSRSSGITADGDAASRR